MARILSTSPLNLATNVDRNVFLTATFDVDLNRDTVNDLTVMLVKTSDYSVVNGVSDYILGTRQVTFQLQELLVADTEYTWILVGRADGILTLSSQVALTSNFQITFKTGSTVNPGIPLANADTVANGEIAAFSGGAGIYTEVWGRTGEPVSHVVTTAGSVGPSGTIQPAPAGSAVYLALSGTVDQDPIEISGTIPVNASTFLDPDDLSTITVGFNDIPVNTGLENGGIDISVANLLELDIDQPTWTTAVSNNTIVITPSEFLGGATYTVTVAAEITGEDSTALANDYTFSFTTKPDYFFTTVRLVRMNLQSAASTYTDADIQLLIYENSLWTYEHSETGFNTDDPPIYIKDYVLCKTKYDVLNNSMMGSNNITRERIGEVEFQYGNNIETRFRRKYEEIEKCIEYNKKLILGGGNSNTARVAVRGGNFEGRPGTSSTWRRISSTGGFGNPNAPGA